MLFDLKALRIFLFKQLLTDWGYGPIFEIAITAEIFLLCSVQVS